LKNNLVLVPELGGDQLDCRTKRRNKLRQTVKMKMVPIRSMFPIGPNKKWLIYGVLKMNGKVSQNDCRLEGEREEERGG
jgi:hypothetical protein